MSPKKMPLPNEDPIDIVDWIKSIKFPLDKDEYDLLEKVYSKKYTGCPISIFDRHSLVVLYWQVRGYLRKSNK